MDLLARSTGQIRSAGRPRPESGTRAWRARARGADLRVRGERASATIERVMELPRTADVVIIGGGVVGCSIAYHLARRGVRDVLVLERDAVGAGTTSKAAGGIRGQFPTETEIRFSLESIRVFERFEDEFGVDPGYRKIGYLFLIAEADDLKGFETRVALQRRLGVDVRIITPSDAQALVPALRVDDLIAAVWGPDDGMAGPAEVTNGFARRARGSSGRRSSRASRSARSSATADACAAWSRRRACRGADRRQRRRSRGGARRAARRRRGARPSATAPHLLHGAVPRDPGTGAAHHRPRERVLLPEGDGAGAPEPGGRRGRRRRLHRRRRSGQDRGDGARRRCTVCPSSRRRASPAAGQACAR